MLSNHHITKGTAAVLAVGAIAAPAASARPARMAPNRPPVQIARTVNPVSLSYSRQDKGLIASSPSHSPGRAAPAAPQASPNGGFDWADAGIGAGGGLVLSLLGIGGVLGLSQRRSGRSDPSAVATG